MSNIRGDIVRAGAQSDRQLGGKPADAVTSKVAKAIATKFTLRPGMARTFSDWQATFTRVVSAAPGFVSLEIIPRFSGSSDWQLVQRFESHYALMQWVDNDARRAMIAQLTEMEGGDPLSPVDEAAPDFHSAATVTEVFTTVVRPGQEEAFRSWVERIQQLQARFPGYMGTLVQAPLSSDVPYWTTLVRFESPAFLDGWLGSVERKAILAEERPQVSAWRSHRMNDAFPGWFANQKQDAPPPAWKQTCLVLLVLFPVVMLEIRYLSPLLAGLDISVSTFIGNAISVSLVSWPLMAFAIAGMKWWLRPVAQERWRIELLGALTIAGLYSLEVLIFMSWL